MKLFKKGRKKSCNNWRGIPLQTIGSKILGQILLSRIQSQVDLILRDEQHGFRPNSSCCDPIFSLRVLLEGSNEWQVQIILVFIDFLKAIDSVHEEAMWKILLAHGMPKSIVNMNKALYATQVCAVQMEHGLSEWFPVESGIRQGCLLSPI